MLGCYLHFEADLQFTSWMLIFPSIALIGFTKLQVGVGGLWTILYSISVVVMGIGIAEWSRVEVLESGDYSSVVEVQTFEKRRGNRLVYTSEELQSGLKIELLTDTNTHFTPGNVLHVKGWNAGFKPSVYPFQFDEKRFAQIRGTSGKVYVKSAEMLGGQLHLSTRQHLLNRVNKWPVSHRTRSFYAAMLLGDKSKVDRDDKQAFATSGLVHVLAVSGLHVGLIALFLEKLTFMLKRHRVIRLLLILTGIWCFVWISGASVSVVRAGLLFTFVQIARLTGRRGVTAEAVWTAAAILVCLNPITIFDLGFQLSFAAVFGIVYGHTLIDQWLRHIELSKPTRFVLSSASVSFWAQWSTSAITLYHFHQFPTYFLLSNVLFLPFIPLLLILGILVMLMDVSGLSIAFVWRSTDFLVNGFFAGVRWLSEWPGALVSSIFISSTLAWAVAFGFILVIISLRKRWKYTTVIGILLPFTILPIDNHSGIWHHQDGITSAIEVQSGSVSTFYSEDEKALDGIQYGSSKWLESRGVDSIRFESILLPSLDLDSNFYSENHENLVFE